MPVDLIRCLFSRFSRPHNRRFITKLRKESKRHRRAFLEALEDRRMLAALPEILKDINPGALGSSPIQFRNINGKAYFGASTAATGGLEIYVSDGTGDGTMLATNIDGGSPDADVVTEVNGNIYFRAQNGVNGDELWKSDGTPAGTALVADIRPGPGSSSPVRLINFNGTLFFRADDGITGIELWKSDGTPAGTSRVSDIFPGSGSSAPENLFIYNGMLYFSANDGTTGNELWKTDGTPGGTSRVLDLNPGSGSGGPGRFFDLNGTLYFTATNGLTGVELWKTDGTAAGTVLVKDIFPGSGNGSPGQFANLNGTLLFVAQDGSTGFELWKSDGTELGTTLLKDFRPGNNNTNQTISQPIIINSTAYFSSNDPTYGTELWRSDGTSAGTTLVKDILPGSASSMQAGVMSVNDKLFFRATDGTTGFELWTSDGTADGTALVMDILPGSGSSNPGSLANINGTLYFAANDGTHGSEPWILKPPATNHAPTAVADALPVNEDVAASFSLTANDTDSDNDDLSILALNTVGTVGLVTTNPNGDTITYDPDGQFEFLAAGETAIDTFSYTISDGRGGTSSAVVTATITGQNDLPEVQADPGNIVINEGQTASKSGFFSDMDLSDDVVITASKGAVTKSGTSDGVWDWSYTGADDESSIVVITANDGHGGVATASFSLAVNNVPPTGIVVTNRALTGSGSNATFTANVAFADPGSDTWTASIDYGQGPVVTQPLTSRTFALNHQYTQSGAFRVTITVTDDNGGSVTRLGNTAITIGTNGSDTIRVRAGSVIIEQNGEEIAHWEDIDDVLVWGGDGNDDIAVESDFAIPAELLGGPGNDIIAAGAGPTVLSGGPGDDTLAGGSGPTVVVGGEGTNTFVPGSGPSTSGSTSAEAFADSYHVTEDGRLVVSASGVLANDVLGSASGSLVVAAVNGQAANVGQTVATNHGEVTLNADGRFSYEPGIGCEATSDWFTYTVIDQSGATSTAMVTITIHKAVSDGANTIDAAGIVRIGGTDANDIIVLTVSGGKLFRNLENTGISAVDIAEIRIWGRNGSDQIDLTGLAVKAFVDGGKRNDVLTGGSLDDVIFGGLGDDTITGGAGNDFLVGGLGKDRMVGSAGHDILVAGDLGCGMSLAALRAISQAWAESHVATTASTIENALDEALADGDSDMLTGSAGADLFIVSSNDKITDYQFGKPNTNKDGDVVIKDGVPTN